MAFKELEATKLHGDDKRKYIVTLFDNIATRYDFIRTLIFVGQTSRWYRKALSDLDLKPGDKVLDVGCGTGESTRYLSRLYQGVAVEGMDISPGMLAVAQRHDPGGIYFEGDVCAIPRVESSYNMVITCFTFRNFPDHETSIFEMLRVLRPGGCLLILDHFHPEKPLWWRSIYTFWIRQIMPRIVRPFVADASPYRYLAESIINQLKLTDFVNLLERMSARVTQTDSYTGGAARRLIAIHSTYLTPKG